MCACECCQGERSTTRRRFRPLALAVQALVVYLLLVLTGGTLGRIPHPVASETGKLIQTVTFVQPTIHWMDDRGLEKIAGGLRLVAGGLPVERLASGS